MQGGHGDDGDGESKEKLINVLNPDPNFYDRRTVLPKEQDMLLAIIKKRNQYPEGSEVHKVLGDVLVSLMGLLREAGRAVWAIN